MCESCTAEAPTKIVSNSKHARALHVSSKVLNRSFGQVRCLNQRSLEKSCKQLDRALDIPSVAWLGVDMLRYSMYGIVLTVVGKRSLLNGNCTALLHIWHELCALSVWICPASAVLWSLSLTADPRA